MVRNSKFRTSVSIRIHGDLDNGYVPTFFSSLTMSEVAPLGSICESSWDPAETWGLGEWDTGQQVMIAKRRGWIRLDLVRRVIYRHMPIKGLLKGTVGRGTWAG